MGIDGQRQDPLPCSILCKGLLDIGLDLLLFARISWGNRPGLCRVKMPSKQQVPCRLYSNSWTRPDPASSAWQGTRFSLDTCFFLCACKPCREAQEPTVKVQTFSFAGKRLPIRRRSQWHR